MIIRKGGSCKFLLYLDSLQCHCRERLVWCLAVAEVGYDGEDDVGHPCCQYRRGTSVDGKGGRDGLQHYIDEAEYESESEVHAHAPTSFARGERRSDDGEYEGGEGGGV